MNALELEQEWDNGFENNNLDPGYMFNKTINYCLELEKKIRALEKIQPVQSKEQEEQIIKVPVLTDLSEDDKRSTIDQFIRMTAKYTLELFVMLGLKSHIESKVINDVTKEEYMFSFKKIQPSQSVQPTKQPRTAEDILYKHTCCMNPYKKDDIIEAMEEYKREG